MDEAADFMRNTEIVADKYAALKLRQLIKSGYIDSSFVPPQMYKNVPIGQIKQMIEQFKHQFRMNNVKSSEEISSFMYNMIKREL
jgi:sugar-specific transcriptional regulator TrmB